MYTFDFIIHRYEVGSIINNNRNTIITTNDLKIANEYYEMTISKLNIKNNIDHNIVFLYDYDKSCNLNYYDSNIDI